MKMIERTAVRCLSEIHDVASTLMRELAYGRATPESKARAVKTLYAEVGRLDFAIGTNDQGRAVDD